MVAWVLVAVLLAATGALPRGRRSDELAALGAIARRPAADADGGPAA